MSIEFITRAMAQGAPKVDLFPEDLQREFGSCETRIVLSEVEWLGSYYTQEVFYKGRWRKVGQTDLFDDVATRMCARKPEDAQTIQKFLSKKTYGARVRDDCISIITHMSDG